MDLIITLALFSVIFVIGFLALNYVVDSRYPKENITVWDGKVRRQQTYRLNGSAIVSDNPFKILMNEFELKGDISLLSYDLVPAGNTVKKVYRAVLRHDYLFAMHQIERVKGARRIKTETGEEQQPVDLPLSQVPPILHAETADGKTVKITLSKTLLFPFSMETAPSGLREEEVFKAKAICQRFVNNQKRTREYLNNTNPFMNTLLASLPLLFIIIANGLVLFLVLNAEMEAMVTAARLINEAVLAAAQCR